MIVEMLDCFGVEGQYRAGGQDGKGKLGNINVEVKMVVEKLVTFLDNDSLRVVSNEENEVHVLQKMRAVFARLLPNRSPVAWGSQRIALGALIFHSNTFHFICWAPKFSAFSSEGPFKVFLGSSLALVVRSGLRFLV